MKIISFIKKDLPIYLGICSVSLSLYTSFYELPTIKQQQKFQAAEMVARYNDSFGEEPYQSILTTVTTSNKAILKEHGGEFNREDLDGYLALFNTLSDLHDNDIIPINLIYNEYSDVIEKSHQNLEIREYIAQQRRNNKNYVGGFDQLIESLLNYEKDIHINE